MSTPWPLAVLIGILGLAIGSFLNVVIYRVPRRESVVSPGSHCPGCDTPIKGRHNVPVAGWLVLRGRCADCRMRISPRYPIVEASTGLLFAAIALRFGLTAELPAFLFLAAVAISLAMIDFDVRALPDTLVLPAYVVGAALLVPPAVLDRDWWPLGRAGLGILLCVGLALAAVTARPTRFDLDDVKLFGLLGMYLAWLSWIALAAAVVLALVAALADGLRVRHRRTLALPVGTCLIVGAILAVFLATPLGVVAGSTSLG